jgi:hypothetical protein
MAKACRRCRTVTNDDSQRSRQFNWGDCGGFFLIVALAILHSSLLTFGVVERHFREWNLTIANEFNGYLQRRAGKRLVGTCDVRSSHRLERHHFSLTERLGP